MKSIVGRAILLGCCFYLFIGFVEQAHSSEYYIYYDSKGGLVISNQKPPPGSKIIEQLTLLDTAGSDARKIEAENETKPNGDPRSSKNSTEK